MTKDLRASYASVYVEALQIVWMHTLSPTISHLLLQGAASKLQPRFVEESAEFIDPGHPDKNWSGVSNYSETLLTFAQAGFARLQLPIKLSGTNEVVAQLISHRGDQN